MLKPNRLFSDNKKFKRGFLRSGVFTIDEANILEQYGIRMQALSSGCENAQSAAEKLFLDEINTKEYALMSSKYAKCWFKYLQHIHKKHINAALYDVHVAAKAENDDLAQDNEFVEDDLLIEESSTELSAK